MRKVGALGMAAVLLISGIGLLGAAISADKPAEKDMQGNTTKFITGTGFNEYGYNYVAHLFSDYYCNVYLKGADLPPYTGNDADYPGFPDAAPWTDFQNHWTFEYRDVKLIMKWNDAWLSNQDRDDDGNLDRHWGYDTYIGSGAWETNHQSGSYVVDGVEYKWSYFVKIVAVPGDAYKLSDDTGTYWYTADGTMIGPDIWGQFAITEQIYNDQGTGEHGIEYLSPNNAGLGAYQ